jgi:hypothetical protein
MAERQVLSSEDPLVDAENSSPRSGSLIASRYKSRSEINQSLTR